MIRIAITAAAYAICSKLPEDAPLWPVHHSGQPMASSTSRRAVLDPLWAVRGPAQAHCDAVGDEDRSDDEEEPVDDSDVENELGD